MDYGFVAGLEFNTVNGVEQFPQCNLRVLIVVVLMNELLLCKIVFNFLFFFHVFQLTEKLPLFYISENMQ